MPDPLTLPPVSDTLTKAINAFDAWRPRLLALEAQGVPPAQMALIAGAAYQLEFVIEKLQLARVPLKQTEQAAAETRPLTAP